MIKYLYTVYNTYWLKSNVFSLTIVFVHGQSLIIIREIFDCVCVNDVISLVSCRYKISDKHTHTKRHKFLTIMYSTNNPSIHPFICFLCTCVLIHIYIYHTLRTFADAVNLMLHLVSVLYTINHWFVDIYIQNSLVNILRALAYFHGWI